MPTNFTDPFDKLRRGREARASTPVNDPFDRLRRVRKEKLQVLLADAQPAAPVIVPDAQPEERVANIIETTAAVEQSLQDKQDLPVVRALLNAAARGTGRVLQGVTGGLVALRGSLLPGAEIMAELTGAEMTPVEELPTFRAGQRLVEDFPASRSVEEGGAFDPTNPRWWLERGVEQVPQLALAVGAGLASGGSLAAFALPTALQEGGNAYIAMRERGRQEGLSEEEAEVRAKGVALMSGLGSAALERIPGSAILFRRIPGASEVFERAVMSRLAGRVAAGAGAEGITEAAQEAWGDVVEYAATQDPQVFEDWKNRYAGSAALGAGVGGAVAGVTPQARRPEAPQAEAPGLRRRIADAIDPQGAEERRQAQRAAEMDEMTGVANRRAFDRARASAEADEGTAIAKFDIIGLKAANDLVSEEKGDELIRTAAEVLQLAAEEVTGSGERVFRTGGDEFAVIAPADVAERIVERARELFPSEQIGEFTTGIRGAVGSTMAEADEGIRAARESEAGPKYRDVRGEQEEEAVPLTEAPADLLEGPPLTESPEGLDAPESAAEVAPEPVPEPAPEPTASDVSAEPTPAAGTEGASVIQRDRSKASASDLAADYKARGMDRQRAWDQFTIDRSLKPELNTKQFYAIYDSVSPSRFLDVEVTGDAKVTHVLTETFGTPPKRVQILEQGDGFVRWVDENGITGSTPASAVQSLEPITETREEVIQPSQPESPALPESESQAAPEEVTFGKDATRSGRKEFEAKLGERRLFVAQDHKGAKTWSIERRTISGADGRTTVEVLERGLTRAEAKKRVRELLPNEPLPSWAEEDVEDGVDDSATEMSRAPSQDPETTPISEQTARPVDPLQANDQISFDLKGALKAAEENAERTNAPEIIKALIRALEAAGSRAPIRVGRIGQRQALGIFKVLPEVIRLREANDIGTAAHEVGHAIEKAVYGWPKGSPWRSPLVEARVQRELKALGVALYGNTNPVGGYKREGWAEFARKWVTEPDTIATEAPHLTAWFEDTFSKTYPEIRKEMEEARRLTTIWREQGSRARAEESVVDEASPRSRLRRLRQRIRRAFTMDEWVEAAASIQRLSQTAMERTGKELPVARDPFRVFSALAMTHTARTRYMVEHGMIDIAGNQVGPSLDEALAPVRGRKTDFTIYLWARRALALWNDPNGQRNPGLSLQDATQIVEELGSPEFEIAARKVYEWQNGVMNYAAQSSPDFAKVVQAIRERDPGDYVPLQREFDDLDRAYASLPSAAQGKLVHRLKGSGRRIKDPLQTLVSQAERIVRQAHERMVIERIVHLGETVEGLGHIIEEVPRTNVPAHAVELTDLIERMSRELEQRGFVMLVAPMDESANPDDLVGEFLTFFAPASTPTGRDPIVPVWRGGKVKWYQVDADLFQALEGLDVYRLPQAAGLLGFAQQIFLEKPAEIFRAGTTGLRASFGLFVNPLRDVQSLWTNTRSQASGKKLFGLWLGSMVDAAFYRTTGKRSEWMDAFVRLGGEMSQSLGQDIPHTRRAAHRLFQNRRQRLLDPRNWWDFYRDLVQTPESAPRVAELRAVAAEIGWEPGMPMTLSQSIALLEAAKQVTVDFTAAGRFSRAMNRVVPFFNVAFQGPRAALRAMRRNPKQYVWRGVTGMTIPALLLWLRYKDEEWWKEMPYQERFLYRHIPFTNPFTGEEELLRIPMSHEAGVLFASMPVMFMDSWYNEDPEEATAFVTNALDFWIPDFTPVLAKEAAQQLANKDFFFETPIVPEAESRRPAREQYNEYTTRVAIELGRILNISPRRVDHAIRNVAGPAAMDAIALMGYGGRGVDREKELADLPVAGRLILRGGPMGTRPKSVDDLYGRLEKAQLKQASVENPETEQERQHRLQMEDATRAIAALSWVRTNTYEASQRRQITQLMADIAQEALRYNEQGTIDRERFAGARREAEAVEEARRSQRGQ